MRNLSTDHVSTTVSSIDELLLVDDSPIASAAPPLMTSTLPSHIPQPISASSFPPPANQDAGKSSRTRGLEELDFLGESALRAHLPSKSPQFDKRNEKLPMNVLQQQRRVEDLKQSVDTLSLAAATSASAPASAPMPNSAPAPDTAAPTKSDTDQVKESSVPKASEVKENGTNSVVEDVKLADLNVPLTSIKPSKDIPPLTLQESEDGISIV